jgi:hypothetical protein
VILFQAGVYYTKIHFNIICRDKNKLPMTVAALSKVWTVFALSNTGIVDSNPNRGMDVCVRLFCLCSSVCSWWPCDRLIPRPRSPADCVQIKRLNFNLLVVEPAVSRYTDSPEWRYKATKSQNSTERKFHNIFFFNLYEQLLSMGRVI